MANANKVITRNSEARLSKLKNKKSQLENLLRSRERLDFEIKNLKKSIAKDQKIVLKEIEQLKPICNAQTPEELISEQVVVDEGENPKETLRKLVKVLSSSEDELISILRLLLKFAETL